MKKRFEQFYKLMLQDLEDCKKKKKDIKEQIECSFHMCNKYWIMVRDEVMDHEFDDPENEIDFFRNLKPMFTAEIEYFNLLYQAHLFEPVDKDELSEFWQREASRLERFIENNKSFYTYYTSGRTDKDQEYFIRSKKLLPGDNRPSSDPATRTTATYDHLIGVLLALKKYEAYAKQRISK